MLSLIPKSIYTGFIQPFPWNHGRFNLIAFLEMLSLLGLTTLAFFGRGKKTKAQKTVIFVCAILFFNLICLTGLTTPSFGAIVRYRVPAHWAMVIGAFVMMGPSIRSISSNSQQNDSNPL